MAYLWLGSYGAKHAAEAGGVLEVLGSVPGKGHPVEGFWHICPILLGVPSIADHIARSQASDQIRWIATLRLQSVVTPYLHCRALQLRSAYAICCLLSLRT